ncbi:MAG: VPS10 domain-containing protein [Longimicrobiales bacterium]
MTRLSCAALWLTVLLPLTAALPPSVLAQADPTAAALSGLEWRSIGPAEMGGRTVDIAAIPGDPSTIYMATATGGLWKTTNGGITWASIFESGGTLSLGAVGLAPSDHNVLYLGTGENNPRNSTSIGDGLYRSTDRGKNWTHIGLENTERIARIRVHPTNPDIVWVAALGHAWGPNEERGVFRSVDGGATWQKVLYVDENTGAADLALDPANPRILYAAMYDYRRRPYHFRSGGPGSGLYKTTDGGETWTELTDAALDNGLPEGPLGRIGVALADSDPEVLYTLIESNDDGVLWKSENAGESWTMVSDEGSLNSRPFYYSDLRVDPTNPNRLFAVSGRLSVSIDGGKSWERIASNIHGDHQSFWIDPEDPDRLIDGNDGGFHFSFDGGETWEFRNQVPLGQFYQISADMRDPYTVCGGLQDNDAWCGPSRTQTVAGSLLNYWSEVIGPGDGMYVQTDPRDPDVMYANSQGGNLFKVDRVTGEARSIQPYPVPRGGAAAGDHPYRFNWNSPVHLSPHDPGTVYFGGNVLFKTQDGGASWEEISPDLTSADPEKLLSSGGDITPDNTTAETHATIYTVAESPAEPGVIWAGTDDGNLQITRNGGATWTNVIDRLQGLPPASWVTRVEASRVEGGRAYVTFDRHRDDDMSPYVYRTDDYGESWENITGNLPSVGYIHVVREDPKNPDLIYVGTELGIHASWTRGGTWHDIRLGLPPVAVRDIFIHPRDNDVIIGTHGRSVFILDDATPLQELSAALGAEGRLFTPRTATRYEPWAARFRFDVGDALFVGENPPYGAVISYYLPPTDTAAADSISLTITTESGDTLRTLKAARKGGITRVAWDLREEPAAPTEDGAFRFSSAAPRVLPGSYRVHLGSPGSVGEGPLNVRLDPRIDWAPDLEAQNRALRTLFDLGERGAEAVRSLDQVKKQLEGLRPMLEESPEITESIDSLESRVDSLAETLVRRDSDRPGSEAVLAKIQGLYRQIDRSTNPPTEPQAAWLTQFATELESALGQVQAFMATEIQNFNERLEDSGIPAVGPPPN